MKIKTITCHNVYNYGATLQAFALQNYLETLGNEVEIIDYKLESHVRYDFFHLPPNSRIEQLCRKFPFLRYIVMPIRNLSQLKSLRRKKAFEKFDKRFLYITKDSYGDIQSLRDNPPEADIYIAGSDQIWNTEMPNGRSDAYYLDFGNQDTIRVSYAASFGVSQIGEQHVDYLKEKLSKFDSISVRENTGLGILDQLGFRGVQVADPVFLLNRVQWIKKLGLQETSGGYIFLYDFLHDDERIKRFARELSQKTELEVYSINDFGPAKYADVQINNAGPKEFLQYLLNANYVVCNSFHATAFSIIFHKDFCTFPLRTQRNSSRMIDLLKDVDLESHYNSDDINTIMENISWNDVESRLEKTIGKSKLYIERVLKEK